jgi:nitrogen fixation protein FixH
MTDQKSKEKPSRIPYIFFAFFGVIFAVNIFYIYIAGQSWRGVVTEKSYQKGVEYNKTIAMVKKQKEMGWKVKMRFKNLGNNSGVLEVVITDKKRKAIKDANIRVYLIRPTQDGFDFDVPMIFSDGKYQARISAPLKGQWNFNLEIMRGYDVFYQAKRYIIQ